jgi:hypothetical protein
MKPGWKTTEFWTTTFAQGLAMLAFLGVLSPTDSQTLGEALGKVTAAVFALIVNAGVVMNYVAGRLKLKSREGLPPGTRILPVLLAAVLIGVFAGPLQASPEKSTTTWLPWRAKIEQQLRDAQRPAPQTPPIIIYPPLQQLPIPGEPKQQLPIPGEPRQPLPIPGAPLQPLPIPGQPQQPLPVPGQPLQPLPYMPPSGAAPQSYTIQRALARPIE